jgi:hypothetical protein
MDPFHLRMSLVEPICLSDLFPSDSHYICYMCIPISQLETMKHGISPSVLLCEALYTHFYKDTG